MSETDTPAQPPAQQPPPPRTRSALRRVGTLARTLTLALVPIALGAGLVSAALWWLLHDENGTRWLLHALPGVTVTAPSGSLLGDFGAERVEIALAAAPQGESHGDRIVVTGLRWSDLRLAWPEAATSWVRIRADRLHAERVDVEIASDPDAPPLAAPADLALPFELELRALSVGALYATPLGEQPLRDVQAAIAVGADGGAAHRIDGLAFGYDRVDVRGSAQIATTRPLVVASRLAVTPHAQPGAPAPVVFDAALTLGGELEKLALQATLRGVASGAAPQTLDIDATLLPFAPWPVASLSAQTQSLDLAALTSSAPHTALSGTINVHSVALDHPATVDIELDNARAGRADEGLLPVRSLRAELVSRPDVIERVEIRQLALELGTTRAQGGSVTGRGSWTPESAVLNARFSAIAPQVLDARAPPMRLAGSANLQADDWFGAGGPPAAASSEPRITLRGRIDGSVPIAGRTETVRLEIDTMATEQHVALRKATIEAGAARAELGGDARRQAGGAWQVTGKGRLASFDPSFWWTAAPGSALQGAKHDLNGTLDVSLLVAANARQSLSLAQLSRSRGNATLQIADSTLAGMPLAGTFSLNGEGDAGVAASAKFSLAGAAIGVDGRMATDANDHWEVAAHAADLAPLAPLLRLARDAGAAKVALAGSADLSASIDGRWPQLASRGNAKIERFAADTLQVESTNLQWTLGSTPQAPLDIRLDVAQAGVGARKLDRVSVLLQGTLAEHRIAVDAESPVRPPAWVDQLHGAPARALRSTGTIAQLRAGGSLKFDAAWQQPLQWTLHLQQLQAQRRASALQTPWFSAKGFDIVAQFDPLTATPQLQLSLGRAELTNLALRWSQLRLRGGEQPAAEIQAEIEPFAVVPLLVRVQPEFGWSGNLVVGGRIDVRSAPTFSADVEFGLVSGDLSVTDEVETQPLELSDLRIALAAHDGVWHFTHALAGRRLGAMAGAATVRTTPQAIWPPANAPLQGVSELRIDDLGAWGAWVPAGWRLRGALQASASFAGRFGAPEFTGHIVGSGLGLRNLLEGIDLQDGELEIALEGETAQIVKLHARGGDGSLDVSGGATFGATPQAKLRAVADKLLLLGRVDRRAVVSGDATLQIDPKRLAVDGAIRVDSALFDVSQGNAPTLGSDVTVLREPAPDEQPALVGSNAAAGGRDVDVRLAIDLGSALRVRGHGLNTLLRGELKLTTPGGRMALNGTVTAYRGTYAAYNQKLEIARGAIVFSGAPENPRLDILALRPDIDVNVGVAIAGTAVAPRISLFSEPDMPDNEKLSWLVLGRAPDDLGGSDTALLQAAAAALLAGEGTAPGSQLTQLIGLDTVSVRQTAGETRDTVVSVGKQISRRWYIGYERSLSSAAGNWQLVYRLARRFTLRLQTGLDNSIDLIWTWRWD